MGFPEEITVKDPELMNCKTLPEEVHFIPPRYADISDHTTASLRTKIPRIYINGGPRRGVNLPKPKRLEQPWKSSDVSKSSDSGNPSENSKKSLWQTSRKQKLILLSLALANIVTWMSLALIAPFFPQEAKIRGVSDDVSGWIFAVFALTQIFACPLYGKLTPVVGVRFLFLSGMLVAGGCTIIFGVLDQISTADGALTFTVFCFVVRIVCAAGASACFTTVFTFATMTFPDHISSVLGLLETAVGIGLMIGPAVGGVLYEAGGYQMPFLVLGGTMVGSIPIYFFVLPKDSVADGESEISTSSSLTYAGLARLPTAVVVFFSLCLSAFTWVTLDPTLAEHLGQFNLSVSLVGLVFLLLSGSYGILAPIIGYLTDRFVQKNFTPVLMIGFLLMAASLLLLGPSPLIGLNHISELWLNLVSMVLLGLGLSITIVPTFNKILLAAENAGYKDDVTTHGLIAGVWTGMFGIGETMGPVFGASVTASDGFEWCMTYVALMCLAMAFILLGLYVYEEKVASKSRKKSSNLSETMETSNLSRHWSNPDLSKKEKEVLYDSCTDERTPLLGTLSI